MSAPKPKLTQGPVGKHLVDMTVPVLFGIATMMAQGLIDTWFIGRVGDAQLAAFSFGFPILMIVTSVAIGLGAGTSSVVARAIGADDHRRARRLSTDSLLLSFLVLGISFSLVEFIGDLAITEHRVTQIAILSAFLRMSAVVMVTLFVVSSTVRELQDKTLEMILAMPIRRGSYYLGKLIGFIHIAALIAIIFSLLLLVYADAEQVMTVVEDAAAFASENNITPGCN